VAKLGLAAGRDRYGYSKCHVEALSEELCGLLQAGSHSRRPLQTLWTAAGKSGPCASASWMPGFDSAHRQLTTASKAATLKNDKSAATKAYGQIQTKTSPSDRDHQLVKTKCR